MARTVSTAARTRLRLLLFAALAVALSVIAAASGAAAPSVVASSESASGLPQLTYSVHYGSRGGPVSDAAGLYIARGDAMRAKRLTGRHDDRNAAWSPDGRLVAFARQTAGSRAIFTVLIADARGRIVRRIAPGNWFNDDPAWSRDGERLALVSGGRGSVLLVGDRLGRNLRRQHTVSYYVRDVEWSRDREWLAYTGSDDTSLPAVYLTRVGSSETRVLVRGASHLVWSPDGRRIAYLSHVEGGDPTDLVVARADGSDPTTIARGASPRSQIAWSPDGRLIAFAREIGARSAIVTVRPDGSRERVVVRSARFSALDPAWRPPR